MRQGMRQRVALLNVRLPKPVVDWLDELVEKSTYKSRSEAVREFIRSCVLSRKEGKG